MTKLVAVIGGSLAGTSAANWLTKHNYKATIIEQNDYIGGPFMEGSFTSGMLTAERLYLRLEA